MSLIGMALALVTQAGAIIWWAAKVDSRVLAVEGHITTLQSADGASLAERRVAADRLSRVETEFTASKNEVNRRLDRIEQKIDRILEGAN